MLWSPPNCFCQKVWVSTATLAPPGLSSSGVKTRPKSGCKPRARKKFSVTRTPLIFCGSPARHGESGKRLRGKFSEALLLIAPGLKARPGNVRAIEAAFRERTPDADELFRIRVGERPEKERVDRGEEDRVCANAERERDDSDDSEPGLAKQLPKCVTNFFHVG